MGQPKLPLYRADFTRQILLLKPELQDRGNTYVRIYGIEAY
jgi:hypothetical protein